MMHAFGGCQQICKYERWDDEKKCIVHHKLEVGKDLSLEPTIMLDVYDHEMDLQDRYEDEQLKNQAQKAVNDERNSKYMENQEKWKIQNMMISFTDYRNDYLKRSNLEV